VATARAATASAGPGPAGRRQGLWRAAIFCVATAAALALVVLVARAELDRMREASVLERVASAAETLRYSLDAYVVQGLPLAQYSGFAERAAPLIAADPGLRGLALHAADGTRLAAAGAPLARLVPPSDHGVDTHATDGLPADATLRRAPERALWQLTLPLHDRFALRGQLAATVALDTVYAPGARLQAYGLAAALAAALVAGAAAAAVRRGREAILAGSFLLFATGTASVLAQAYADEVHRNAEASLRSLAERLTPIVRHDLSLADLRGLEALLDRHERAAPALAGLTIAVRDEGRVTAQGTAPALPADAGRDRALQLPVVAADSGVRVSGTVPVRVVWARVADSVEDLGVLLIACGVLGLTVFGVARTLEPGARAGARDAAAGALGAPGAPGARGLALAQLPFLLAVMAEYLSYSFLSPLLARTAEVSGLGAGVGGLLMTAYFAGFVLALVPGGRAAERRDPRRLAAAGALLAAAGLAAMAWAPAFWPVLGGRLAAGLGQGLLLASIQGYLLRCAGPAQRTRAGAVIVFGFNGGLIAGAALGGLALRALGPDGVFLAAAALAGLAAAGCLAAPHDGRRHAPPDPGNADTLAPRPRFAAIAQARAALRETLDLAGRAEVLRPLLLIGGPAKATLTGLVLFALPLMLTGHGVAADRVAHAIVLYALVVLAVSKLIAGPVDRSGLTAVSLVAGAVTAAVGVALLAGLAAAAAPDALTLLLGALFGVLLIGVGHGCINAPVMAYVAAAAAEAGRADTEALNAYRLLERVGHVLGPVAIGGAYHAWGAAGLVAVALATAGAGAAFALSGPSRRRGARPA
jgi:predicted MFS family arabinose efflux permease